MKAFLLDATTDRDSWNRVLSQMPSLQHDVYFRPEYLAMHCFNQETEALAFQFSDGNRVWLYPFLRARIVKVGSRNYDDVKSYDIASPYGYGGPLANSYDSDFLANAQNSFSEWAESSHVIAEFVRLHPLVGNESWLDPQTEVTDDRETVSINLEATAARFRSDARYMIRRAHQAGVVVKDYPPMTHFDRFIDLYIKAMEKIGAATYYFFSKPYFEQLKLLVTQAGLLLVAEQDGAWIAAGLFLKGSQWMHYHLSANNVDLRVPGATNAIIAAASDFARNDGLDRLHLGGGRTTRADDALLKFKESMGTDHHVFRIAKRVRNGGVYDELCRVWREAYPALASEAGGRFLCYREKPVNVS